MAKKELFSDVDELVSSLNKELGEGSIMNFGDDKPIWWWTRPSAADGR